MAYGSGLPQLLVHINNGPGICLKDAIDRATAYWQLLQA
jgi:hypothetical protein